MGGDDWPENGERPRLTSDDRRRRVDDLLETLAARRRRDLLYHLESVEVTDVETLAAELAAAEEGVPIEDVSDETRERNHVELVHVHLPRLADLSLVEFDRRTGAIRCRNLPPMAERFLALCRDLEVED